MPCGGDANGHQHRTVHDPPGLAHTLITGIENHIGRLLQGPGAPGLQSGVEQRGAATDLRGGNADLRAHQLLQYRDDIAG